MPREAKEHEVEQGKQRGRIAKSKSAWGECVQMIPVHEYVNDCASSPDFIHGIRVFQLSQLPTEPSHCTREVSRGTSSHAWSLIAVKR